MLALVCLNGFTKRDTQRSLCGRVRDMVDLLETPPGFIHYGMGGAGVAKFNSLYRKLRDLPEGSRLLLVGHSYGAHWNLRMVRRMARRDELSRFDRVVMVSSDPQFVLHPLTWRAKRVPEQVQAYTYRQAGVMGGYPIEPGYNELLEATHGDIATNRVFLREVESLLLDLNSGT